MNEYRYLYRVLLAGERPIPAAAWARGWAVSIAGRG